MAAVASGMVHDENYDSTELDEDELNRQIQDQSIRDSTNPLDLARAQTEPHGALNQYEHNYTGYNGKHVKRVDKVNPKHSYKQDDQFQDVDVVSVASDNDHSLNHSIQSDQYMDHSVLVGDEMKYNRGGGQHSALDSFKNGIISAKKRLLTPSREDHMNGHNTHHPLGDIPNPTTSHPTKSAPIPSSGVSSESMSDADHAHHNSNGHSGRASHSSKNSAGSLFGAGSGLLSKGKGLFGRKEGVKDDDEKGPHRGQHRKTPSKTNLGNLKQKIQGIAKTYSSKNIHGADSGGGQGHDSPLPDDSSPAPKKSSKKKRESKSHRSTTHHRDNHSRGTHDDPKHDAARRRKKSRSDGLQRSEKRNRSSSQKRKKVAESSHMKSSKSSTSSRGVMSNHSTSNVHSKPPKKRSNAQARSRSQKPPRSDSQKVATTNNPASAGTGSHDRRNKFQSSSLGPKEQKLSGPSNAHHDRMKQMKHGRKSTSQIESRPLKRAVSQIHPERGSGAGKEHKKRAASKQFKDRRKDKLAVEREKKLNRRKSYNQSDWKERAEKKMAADDAISRSMLAEDKKCKFRIKNEIFELYEYYKPVRLIGSGAYAVVCEAIDLRTKKHVAIKKNKHIFDDIRDARRILREVKLLLHFNKYKHPDLISIYDTLPPTLSEIQDFEDVYIVMPLMESNLCKIITSKQKLSNLHYQYLTYQVMRGLAFIHESGVIHRDIKPENILLNGNDCDVKIIDFGLARGVLGEDGQDDQTNTEYVCTRWYRSPEVMCSGGRYDEKMDIWGVGCILAEMILRRPLFPGANYLDQLQQIFDIMGTPESTDWILNEQARSWVQKLPKHNGKDLKKMIAHKFEDNPDDLDNCADLLHKMLTLSPKNRTSAKDLLSHPYFKDMHDEDEILTGNKFDLSFEFEKSIKTKFGVRHMMFTTLQSYHKKTWLKIKKKQKKREQREREKAAQGGDGKTKKHKDRGSRHKSKSNKHKSTMDQ